MYYRLALKNLRNQKSRTALIITSIAIGITSLVLLAALSSGLQKALYGNLSGPNPLTQITVLPVGQQGGFLKILQPGPTKKITPAAYEEIKNIPHVVFASPEMLYDGFSSVQVSMFGQTFQTDSLIFGVPYEFITGGTPESAAVSELQLTPAAWKNPAEPYPLLFSAKIIDLYNFTVAPSGGLPSITQTELAGTDLYVLPGQSTFFPMLGAPQKVLRAKVSGFADNLALVGVTLPISVVRELNLEKNANYEENYSRVFVQVDSAEFTDTVSQQIRAMGFETLTVARELQSIEENLQVVTGGLGLISGIILFIAGLMIAGTFLSAVRERKHEIGIFRALGASRAAIQKMFLAEASVIGFMGGLAGIVIGIITGSIIDGTLRENLPALTAKPETLFVFDPLSLLLILLFAVLLSTIFAFIPSAQAARLRPLEALSE